MLVVTGIVHSMTTKVDTFKSLVDMLNKKSFGEKNDRQNKRKNKKYNRKN